MKINKQIWGRWTADDHSVRVKLIDYRAGNLVASTLDGETMFGLPDRFRSDEGVPGETVLERLMSWPRVAALVHGCLRETLANAASIARIGRQETRDFDGPNTYFADNNEGSLTCLTYVGRECIGLSFSKDPFRAYDYGAALQAMPESLLPHATNAAAQPIFCGQDQAFTAVFWSVDGTLASHEPWATVYAFMGDILELELSNDANWFELAEDHHELPPMCLRLILDVVSRVEADGMLRVRAVEQSVLFPPSEPYSATAIEELVAGGRVEFTGM